MKDKKEKSNNLRVNALEQREKEREKRNKAVQDALQSKNGEKRKINHLTFESSDEEEQQEVKRQKTDNLLGFGSDDDGEADDFTLKVRPQFEGKKGAKLMMMQEKVGYNNERFQFTEDFLDDEEDSDESEDGDGDSKEVGGDVEKVKKKKSVKFQDANQTRYDPADKKFKQEKVAKKPKKVKKVKPLSEQAAPEVDKSRYFQANQDALKEAFGQNEGEETTEKMFTFGDFGSGDEEEENESSDEDGDKSAAAADVDEDLSHFTQLPDSECEEEEEEEVVEQEEEEEYYEPAAVVQPPVFNQQHKDNQTPQYYEWLELEKAQASRQLLFPTADYLMKIRKLAPFLTKIKSQEVLRRDWEEKKDALREDYKKKHRDWKRAQKRGFKEEDMQML